MVFLPVRGGSLKLVRALSRHRMLLGGCKPHQSMGHIVGKRNKWLFWGAPACPKNAPKNGPKWVNVSVSHVSDVISGRFRGLVSGEW
jgi:hypothetical protein